MNKEKHLEFIESTIARMSNCSFIIKGWVLTIISAIFILAEKDSNFLFIIIALLIIPFFWLLDGFYLSKERQYRALYDQIRIEKDSDYSMDTSKFNCNNNSWGKCILSKTLIIFYMPLFFIIVLFMLLLIFDLKGII